VLQHALTATAVDCGRPPIALRCSPLAGSGRRGAIRVRQRQPHRHFPV